MIARPIAVLALRLTPRAATVTAPRCVQRRCGYNFMRRAALSSESDTGMPRMRAATSCCTPWL
jgi:hypothetical protein